MSAASLRPARLALLGVFLSLGACDSVTSPNGFPVPPETGDGWATGAPESVGLASAPLLALTARIDGTPEHRIHGLLVVRRNTLVYERYWPGTDLEPNGLAPVQRDFDRDTRHYVASVSKSLTSALVGIALEHTGATVGDGIFSFFPEHADLAVDQRGDITLEHLLSFSSGLEWNEFVYGFDDPRDSHNQMFAADDPVRQLLGRAVTYAPGSRFHYNSGDSNLAGEIARRLASATTLVDYARVHLFGVLGIDDVSWLRFGRAPHVTFASGGASLRPRDMAKFGQVYLDRGVWNSNRVIPAAWVDASVTQKIPLVGYRTLYGYGYNWWLGRSPYRGGSVDYYMAAGWGGQYIFVFPALDLVVVHTGGGYYDQRPLAAIDLIQDHVLAAITD